MEKIVEVQSVSRRRRSQTVGATGVGSTTSTKRVKKKKSVAKKKESKADFLRRWGLPNNFQYRALRYKSPPEKGVLWYYFSKYIRARDIKKYGSCISCDRTLTEENANAGHFMPARGCGRDLLFNETNVNGECQSCNAWDDTHLLGYAEGLDKRYGKGTANRLRAERDAYEKSKDLVRDWGVDVYREYALYYKNLTK